jgi:hypothetical protein
MRQSHVWRFRPGRRYQLADGDLMFYAGSLWVASYYRLPMLVVMYNNRAYYNDWEHQERLEIDRPAPDFAALARSFEWYAEGPIETPPRSVRPSAAPPTTCSRTVCPPWSTSSANPASVVRRGGLPSHDATSAPR